MKIKVFLLIIFVLLAIGCVDNVKDYDKTLVRDYEIVKTEGSSERENFPLKVTYQVIVPQDISKDELKATLIQVVMDKTAENPDIDGIVIFAYDGKEDISEAYTFAKAEWLPNGNWADITPTIASTNDRSSYQYNFEIKDKVGNIGALNVPTEREYGIYYYYDERYFDEAKKLQEAQNVGMQYKYADILELDNAVTTEVANKYGISEEELDKIYIKVSTYQSI